MNADLGACHAERSEASRHFSWREEEENAGILRFASFTGQWLRSVVQGYFNYHAVPGNLDSLRTFRNRLTQLWHAQLLRRSHRRRLTWERMNRLADRRLPTPHVLHPWPITRFAAHHPR
jgi:hypothetical protein